jgi:hypothetical protein
MKQFLGHLPLIIICIIILSFPNNQNYKHLETFDNTTVMKKDLQKRGFTVYDDKTIFKGTEFAGNWDYKTRPVNGTEHKMPVEVGLILKYRKE